MTEEFEVDMPPEYKAGFEAGALAGIKAAHEHPDITPTNLDEAGPKLGHLIPMTDEPMSVQCNVCGVHSGRSIPSSVKILDNRGQSVSPSPTRRPWWRGRAR